MTVLAWVFVGIAVLALGAAGFLLWLLYGVFKPFDPAGR